MTPTAPTPHPCNCIALREAARHVSQFYDRHLAPAGLRTSQYSLLSRLHGRGRSGIGALATELVMDRTTLGRNLRPLERDGLVAIDTDPRDRRGRAVGLTAAGAARLAAARALWRAAQQDFESRYGSGEAAGLRQALARLVAIDLAEPPLSEGNH